MTIIEQARKIRADMNAVTATLTDEQGLELITLFEPWRTDLAYAVGDRVRHGDKLYKCVQAHTSQADWPPNAAPSLWVRIDDPAIEWPAWVQPESTNPYNTGDKVTFEGKRYISKINANTWSPSAYPAGWEVQA